MKTRTLIAFYIIAALPAALLAAAPVDRQIEDAANNSYNYKAVLDGRVSVKSSDGAVTLTGTVADKADKTLAEDTVKSLPGVVSVDNEIGVDSTYPKYSDAWIGLKIHSLLLVRANVSATDTKVAVQDGVVTLTGTVSSDTQRDLTEAYVKTIDHVKSVKDELVVKTPEPDQDSAAVAVDDASVTAQVKYALFSDSTTSAMRTKVTTDHGVVIVTGEAASNAEKDSVTQLAKSIRGVKSVRNMMTVRP